MWSPPDGVWIRRTSNGWHVVEPRPDEDGGGVIERVYEDPPVPFGSVSVDNASSRSLCHVLWDCFDSYMRSKHMAGLSVDVLPALNFTEDSDE